MKKSKQNAVQISASQISSIHSMGSQDLRRKHKKTMLILALDPSVVDKWNLSKSQSIHQFKSDTIPVWNFQSKAKQSSAKQRRAVHESNASEAANCCFFLIDCWTRVKCTKIAVLPWNPNQNNKKTPSQRHAKVFNWNDEVYQSFVHQMHKKRVNHSLMLKTLFQTWCFHGKHFRFYNHVMQIIAA